MVIATCLIHGVPIRAEGLICNKRILYSKSADNAPTLNLAFLLGHTIHTIRHSVAICFYNPCLHACNTILSKTSRSVEVQY